jgi:hypothetical protein
MHRQSALADIEAVRSSAQHYVATWNAGHVSQLKTFWDGSLAQPVYIAEEAEAMFDWPSIEAYWAALDGVEVAVTVGEMHLSHLSDDVIAAVYPMHWRIRFENHSHWKNPIGGNLRVSVCFARRGAAWKIVHYVEAPYAASVQTRKWLERDALGPANSR